MGRFFSIEKLLLEANKHHYYLTIGGRNMSKQFTEKIAPNKEKLLEFLNGNIKCYVPTKIEIVTDNGNIVKFNERDVVAIVKLLKMDKDILFTHVFAWNIDREEDVYIVTLYI